MRGIALVVGSTLLGGVGGIEVLGGCTPGAASEAAPPSRATAEFASTEPPAPASDAECSASSCEACTKLPGCSWCTSPRGCQSATAAQTCEQLSLAHPSHCTNDPTERAQAAAAAPADMTRDGPPVIARLENFPGIEFPIARGHCSTLTARLQAGAKPADVVASFKMTTPRASHGGLSGRPSADHPQLSSGRHCPLDPGTLSIRFVNRLSYSPTTAAGSGSIEVQLWRAPISEGELTDLERRHSEVLRRIDSMPADCDDCGFNCRQVRGRCERRCFVNHRERYDRDRCEETCEQIGDACEAGCSARCR